MNRLKSLTEAMLMGIAVGDAMGVPYEFMTEEELKDESLDEMKGYGTYDQPPGSFSDDSSMTFCLVESLIKKESVKETAQQFIKWKNEAYWTANDETFDIGITTDIALSKIENGIAIDKAAPNDERSNGNGALMRVMPLAFYVEGLTMDEKFALVEKYAGITHGHLRSHMACLILVEYAALLIKWVKENGWGMKDKRRKMEFHARATTQAANYFHSNERFKDEIHHFLPFIEARPGTINAIKNSGYVVHSLELALYSFLKYNRYEMTIKRAIWFGGDTDTNASIAGGLSALYYGMNNIPERWRNNLLKKDEILDLADRWAESIE